MSSYRVVVGKFVSPLKNYNISKLCLLGKSFSTVFVKKVQATAINVVKGSAISIVGKDNIAVVHDLNGDIFYYHPRYRRWYKNLSDDSLYKYFSWLIPQKRQ